MGEIKTTDEYVLNRLTCAEALAQKEHKEAERLRYENQQLQADLNSATGKPPEAISEEMIKFWHCDIWSDYHFDDYKGITSAMINKLIASTDDEELEKFADTVYDRIDSSYSYPSRPIHIEEIFCNYAINYRHNLVGFLLKIGYSEEFNASSYIINEKNQNFLTEEAAKAYGLKELRARLPDALKYVLQREKQDAEKAVKAKEAQNAQQKE